MTDEYTEDEVKKRLKTSYFPEGFFSKKRPQEKPKEYIVPLTYDDIYYGIWKDPKELIRCKDCKHWDDDACFVDANEDFADDIILDRFEYDYCSRAERREE